MHNTSLPNTVTKKAILHAQWDKWLLEFKFFIFSTDMTDHGYILVAEKEITFEIPEGTSPSQLQISLLEKAKEKLLAESHRKETLIDEEIQSLRSIAYKPETDVEL